jgi:hypothetical protein
MNEIARHVGMKLDLSFGTISFEQDASGTYACVNASLAVGTEESPDNSIAATLRIPISPEKETVLAVVDKCRRLLANVFKSSTDYFQAISAEKLLFQKNPPS